MSAERLARSRETRSPTPESPGGAPLSTPFERELHDGPFSAARESGGHGCRRAGLPEFSRGTGSRGGTQSPETTWWRLSHVAVVRRPQAEVFLQQARSLGCGVVQGERGTV